MPLLFDMSLRALRRDRAARQGTELFLYDRAFEDCLDRLSTMQRLFESALLVGCLDPSWRERLGTFAREVEVRDPGSLFATKAGGKPIVEDAWEPQARAYDLVVAVGTLDTVNDLPLSLRLIRHSIRDGGILIGAISGGDTLTQLRSAMRAADAVSGVAAPHVHPRVEASQIAPLLESAGFRGPVIDVDRVTLSYRSFDRLVGDLRAMGATNSLIARPRFVGRQARAAAVKAFADAGEGGRTIETVEILHFIGWAAKDGLPLVNPGRGKSC